MLTRKINDIVQAAQKIVIIQADNPDADSLGSALALEHILGDMGKQPFLYCGVEMPGYLRYLSGWDRVQTELPRQFDASIIVDASTMTLLERLTTAGQQGWLAAKPCVVLDHHETVSHPIPFATVVLCDYQTASSTGELIYHLSQQLKWQMSVPAQACLLTAILGDTQGLSNQLAHGETYRVVGAMIDAGVDRSQLEEARREYAKMPPEIFKYKALLINHTELADNGKIAMVMVPQVEINQYSPLYNPGPLIQNDMLQTRGVQVAIVFKRYDDGKVTAAIRCNPGYGIGARLAEHFGGGGHAYASGFKLVSSRSFDDIKQQCVAYATDLLQAIEDQSE